MSKLPLGNVAHALETLIGKPPSVLSTRPGNLYQVLSRTPDGGVGRKVHMQKWSMKRIPNCYWEVTKSQFKNNGNNGKAWGILYWQGKKLNETPMRITGALKYSWKEGPSHPNIAPGPRTKEIQSIPKPAPTLTNIPDVD